MSAGTWLTRVPHHQAALPLATRAASTGSAPLAHALAYPAAKTSPLPSGHTDLVGYGSTLVTVVRSAVRTRQPRAILHHDCGGSAAAEDLTDRRA